MKLLRRLLVVAMALVFLFGLGTLLYPHVRGRWVDQRIEADARHFLSRVEIEPYVPDPPGADVPMPDINPGPTEPEQYAQLWHDMMRYNRDIFQEGQSGLDSADAYETPSFHLKDYGLDSEVFAVLTIPALELEMPVYLGATHENMAAGAALLSQTSIPVGGTNTNAVIAGHRGWRGSSYFRYIDRLELGDEVILTNLWEELHYVVTEIRIIQPNEVEQILIRPGRELVTQIGRAHV